MEIILKSLASAVVTACILLIAKFSGPRIAGAIGGIPIVFAMSYVILTLENKNLSQNFLMGGVYGAIAGIFFSLVLIWFNNKFVNTYWLNFLIAYILCFLLALFMVKFTTK